MIEFTISFSYNNTVHKAMVLMSGNYPRVEYNVRPFDPSIVRKYGRQISIFQEQERFNTNNHIATDHKDFFNGLVNAIQLQDRTLQMSH